jgi:hypothetical protein
VALFAGLLEEGFPLARIPSLGAEGRGGEKCNNGNGGEQFDK